MVLIDPVKMAAHREALLNPVVVHTSNPSTREMGSRGWRVQDQPWLSNVFEASLGYMRPCLKKRNKQVGEMAQGSLILAVQT